MKLLFCLVIAILIYSSSAKAQDDNTISLKDLSYCAMKFTINDADETISKYGYRFVSTKKVTFKGKACDKYTYSKESGGVMEYISLYKNSVFDPFDNTLKVLYNCLFEKNFKTYKKELEEDKNNIFIGEKSNGDCFDRNYEGMDFNYIFSICNMDITNSDTHKEYPNTTVYIITITFNNGAGLLRKK